jgi:hypothetical protein
MLKFVHPSVQQNAAHLRTSPRAWRYATPLLDALNTRNFKQSNIQQRKYTSHLIDDKHLTPNRDCMQNAKKMQFGEKVLSEW